MRRPDGRLENPPATPVTTPPTTTPPTTTTPPRAFPTAQESELLIHVPKDFRATCTRATVSPVAQADAVVVCTPSTGANSVCYYVFRTTDKMYGWYFGLIDEKSIARGAGNCNNEQEQRPRTLGMGIKFGHLACYREGGKSYTLWTYDKLAIGGAAYRNDLNDATLYQWWTNAGLLIREFPEAYATTPKT
jgi:hypothetical protein